MVLSSTHVPVSINGLYIPRYAMQVRQTLSTKQRALLPKFCAYALGKMRASEGAQGKAHRAGVTQRSRGFVKAVRRRKSMKSMRRPAADVGR